MELKTYIRVVLGHWWIVIPVLLITFAVTVVLTLGQTPIYQSNATYVITPSTEFGDIRSFASGLDTLSRRTEIASTYSEVATSQSVRKAALEKLI